MKYWAYVNNEILGPFEKEKLRELPSFSPALLVCPQTPVGEKTEDWKEVSAYPELSSPGGAAPAPAPAAETAPVREQPAPEPLPAPAPEPAAAQEPRTFPQSAIDTTNLNFKPLMAAKEVEPVPPHSNSLGMADITVNQLTRSGRSEAPSQAEPVPQSSSGFDPISLSTIVNRTENVNPHSSQAGPAEGLTLEPRSAQPDDARETPAPGQGVPVFNPDPAFGPAQQAAPAPGPAAHTEAQEAGTAMAAGAPVTDTAGLQKLIERLDELSKSSATRRDLDSAIDPLRLKLDQMGEVISSIKNSQFQREVMDKLSYLENAVGELKETLRGGAPQAAAAAVQPQVQMEKASDIFFGAQPVKEAEKPKAEPPKEAQKEAAKPEPKDLGTKRSGFGTALKKAVKMLMTLILLAALLVTGVVLLKNFGVFDATQFIPFPLPFISAPQTAPTQEPAPAEPGQEQPPLSPEPQGAAPQEQAQAAGPEEVPQNIVPEIIYIARTYKAAASGDSLENKIYAHAGKAGGNYNETAWKVRPSGEPGKFEIDALIPSKEATLTYTFLVDREKKNVLPVNPEGKVVFASLAEKPPRKAAPRPSRKKPAAKPAPKPAPKPAVKLTAEEKPEDAEYEYVYVDEEEEGAE